MYNLIKVKMISSLCATCLHCSMNDGPPFSLPGGVYMWVVLFVCHLIRDGIISMERGRFWRVSSFTSGISCVKCERPLDWNVQLSLLALDYVLSSGSG